MAGANLDTSDIAYKSSFTGNKVICTAARDTNELSSGWKTPGVAVIPSQAPSYPSVEGMSPSTVTGSPQIIESAQCAAVKTRESNRGRLLVKWGNSHYFPRCSSKLTPFKRRV